MLREYIVTPQVLLRKSYGDADLYRLALLPIWEEIESLGLLRNYSDGEWARFLESTFSGQDVIGAKILKSAFTRRRVVQARAKDGTRQLKGLDWKKEAILEHRAKAAAGIIVEPNGNEPWSEELRLADVLHLDSCEWWSTRRDPCIVHRNLDGFRKAFAPFFTHANKIDLVDPYLGRDKDHPHYDDFPRVLALIRPACSITIHRMVWGKPNLEHVEGFDQWAKVSKRCFKVVFREKTAFSHTSVPFHDRYFLSELACLAMTNGFDFDSRSMTVSKISDAQAKTLVDFFDKHYGPSVSSMSFQP